MARNERARSKQKQKQKQRREKKRKRPGAPARTKTVGEWVVGCFEVPGLPEGHQALVILELPLKRAVFEEVGVRDALVANVREGFRAACATPLFGGPRRPARLRAADAELGSQLEGEPNVRVRVEATPEIDEYREEVGDEFVAEMNPRMRDPGSLPPELEARLYAAAEAAQDPELWVNLPGGMLLGVDVAEVERTGLGVWPVHADGRLWGLLVFESLEAARSYRDNLSVRKGRAVPRLGLTLDFEEAVSPEVVAAVRQRAPQLVELEVYPQLDRMGAGLATGPDDSEVRLLVSILEGLIAVSPLKLRVLGADPIVRTVEVDLPGAGTVTFRVDAPKRSAARRAGAEPGDHRADDAELDGEAEQRADADEAGDLEELGEEWDESWDEDEDEDEDEEIVALTDEQHAILDRLAAFGRNDPCPCGSGKKYKKCHLVADEQLARDLA